MDQSPRISRPAPRLVALPELPSSLTDLKTLADVFYASGLFSDIRDASQALVKIIKGQELGLQPVAAMHAFDIIQGRIYVRGQTCAALLNTCPYASYTPVAKTDTAATIRFRKRQPDGTWADLPDITYTIEEAQRRGLTQRPEWKHAPANMLYWRAMTRGTAQYFPELISGTPAEEEAPAPISAAQAQAHIAALYGSREPESAPDGQDHPTLTVDPQTGEVQEAADGGGGTPGQEEMPL